MKLVVALFAVSIFFADSLSAADLYPEARAIIHEAEIETVKGNQSSDWVGGLYARSGYLDDAARILGNNLLPYSALWVGRAVYGDKSSVEKSVDSIVDPEKRAYGMTAFADLSWKMGELGKAKECLENAKRTALKVSDLQHRQKILATVDRGYSYMTEMPPQVLSATPQPHRQRVPVADEALLPPFPITPEGLGGLNSENASARAERNAQLLEKLYGRIAARDREGLMRIADHTQVPFERALVMASLEHLLLQANQPELAEQYANAIPEAPTECALAKAEGLNAAASAWLRAGVTDRAQTDFDAAIRIVQSTRGLPFGRVSVMITIAKAQVRGGMTASGGASLKQAQQYAQELPLQPLANKRQPLRPMKKIEYRNEAYSRILVASIDVHDLGSARRVAEDWNAADVKASTSIVNSWLQADKTDEALAFARKCDKSRKVTALLVIARSLLDDAGAPNF